MSGRNADVDAWIAKAEHDLLAADLLLAAAGPLWDIVVFHAQQAAEKLLKSMMVSRGVKPLKTHDLTRLLTLCVTLAPDLARFADDCAFLSPLAVLSRYPGGEDESAQQDAERGVEIARRLKAAITPYLDGPTR